MEKSPSAFPVFDQTEDAPVGMDEPVESAAAGGPAPTEVAKRKRRRKKGKGGGAQNTAQLSEPEAVPETAREAAADVTPSPAVTPRPAAAPQPRPKLDPESVAKLAWKIYLAEVSEEGVALIGDNDAKELSRRCFRLAEIFVEEQTRRR